MNSTSDKKHILLVANYSKSGGGITVQVQSLMDKLAQEPVRVSLFNTKKNALQRAFVLPLSLVWKGRGADVFHIHGCSYTGFYPIVIGILAAQILRKKTVVTYHGGDAALFFAKYPAFVSFFFRRANAIIVQSLFLAQIFKKYGFDAAVIPNIIDLHALNVSAKETLLPKLVTTRSLKDIYDITTAIKALELVQLKYPDASLCIVGSGPEEEHLKAMVRAKGLRNIFFAGQVQNEQIYQYLANSYFWCNPSTKDNMPVSLLEAINAGLIIVSTDVGGIPYMVEHQKSAWLVPEAAPEAMAAGILHLLENPAQAHSFVQNARETLRQYDWKQIRRKLLPLYLN